MGQGRHTLRSVSDPVYPLLNLDPGHPLIIKPDKQSKEVKENQACNRKKCPT